MRSDLGRATRFALTTILLIIASPLAFLLLSKLGFYLAQLAKILLR